jgi:hypothetical protein
MRTALALAATAMALMVAGCASDSGDIPAGVVAVVDHTEITREELDSHIDQARRAYEAAGQDFPRVGTPEYQQIQQQSVAFLVQKAEFEQMAEELEVEVTDADLDLARAQIIQSRFSGDERRFLDSLEKTGFTEESFRRTLRVSVLSEKLFEAVAKDVKVTDQEALAYYTENPDRYRGPKGVTPFARVKAAIKAQLVLDKRKQLTSEWLEDLVERFEDKVDYAEGFAPPGLPESAKTQTETQ